MLHRPNFGQCKPNTAESGTDLVEPGPTFAETKRAWPRSMDIWRSSPEIGQSRPNTVRNTSRVEIARLLVDIGGQFAGIAGIWPKSPDMFCRSPPSAERSADERPTHPTSGQRSLGGPFGISARSIEADVWRPEPACLASARAARTLQSVAFLWTSAVQREASSLAELLASRAPFRPGL